MKKKRKNKQRTVDCNSFSDTRMVGGLSFKKSGEFHLVDGELVAHICRREGPQTHIVYMHIVDGDIVYIGESSDTLKNRMRLYIVHTGSTNVKVRQFLRRSGVAGKSLEIYSYKPRRIEVEGVLPVNPYIGIEQELISRLNPPLNEKDTAG